MDSRRASGWSDCNKDNILVRYCLESSLHGLKYVGEPKRHILERAFWMIAFVASFATSAVLISRLYKDYNDNTIITVFHPVQQTLDNIPFPSITVCNPSPFQASKLTHQFMASLRKEPLDVSKDDYLKTLARLADMFQICDSSDTFIEKIQRRLGSKIFEPAIREVRNKIQQENVSRHMNPKETLEKLGQPCNEIILHCVWLGKVVNCSEIFTDVYTDYGRCCTFNSIPTATLLKHNQSAVEHDGWMNLTYEKIMFTEETKFRKYPARQRYPGRSAGLSFMLDLDLEEFVCPSLDGKGVVMGINVPLDMPRIRDSGVVIRTNSETFIGIKPEITMMDETVKAFNLMKRKCYRENDYILNHYTKYTVSNCLNECIAKETMARCGCLRYYMPGGQGLSLCKLDRFNCTIAVEADILEHGITGSCSECLPTCTEIVYHHEMSSLGLNVRQISKLSFNRTWPKFKNPTLVHVYMDSHSVFSKLRKEMTSTTQLLSSAGGIFGLCMGFSILSLLEIVYHGTLRPLFSFLRRKHATKAVIKLSQGQEKDLNRQKHTCETISRLTMQKSSNVAVLRESEISDRIQCVWD